MLPTKANQPVNLSRPRAIITDPDAVPVSLADLKHEMGIDWPQVAAEDLVDHTLTIIRAKPFQSSFDDQRQAWFCVCKDSETGATVATVIGGEACVEILEAYAMSNPTAPLVVILRKHTGGSYGRYYTFE